MATKATLAERAEMCAASESLRLAAIHAADAHLMAAGVDPYEGGRLRSRDVVLAEIGTLSKEGTAERAALVASWTRRMEQEVLP